MPSNLIKLIKKAAAWYKPVDKKMLKYPLYQRVSISLKKVYYTIAYQEKSTYFTSFQTMEVDTKVALFETFWGRNISCNPYAIYRGMVVDDRFLDYRFIWVKNTNTHIPDDVKNDPRVSLVYHKSKDYQTAIATAGLLINNTTFPPYFVRRPEQKYINTYHGIPLKKMGFDIDDKLSTIANTQRNFIQATHLLSGGPYTDDFLFKPYGAMPLFEERIIHTGYPRIDLSQQSASPKLYNSLGLKGDKPVILFAPTWRGTVDSFQSQIDDLIQSVEKLYSELSKDFDVFVSLHNLVLSKAKNLPKNMRLIPPGLDVNEVMAAVDILISDYSSILVDYLVLDRPLILFVPDQVEYAENRGLYLPLNDLPGAICETLEDVIEAVKAAKTPSKFHTYASTIATLLPNQDGQATQRVLDAISMPETIQPIKAKKRILLNMNALGNNGITTSFLNLTNTLDHDTTEVYVMLDAGALDSSTVNMINFFKINPNCYPLLRIGASVTDLKERRAIRELSDPSVDITTDSERLALHSLSREARRILSDAAFDAAVDFAGYSSFWANLICVTNSESKVIFQHNDLYSEFHNQKKSHKRLIGVFRAYKRCDIVAPVSKEIGAENYRQLKAFYKSEDQVKPIRNTIQVDAIRERAEEPLELTCPDMAQCMGLPMLKIITLGRLSPEKNQARLIKAFSIARSKGLQAILFIAGTGPLLGELKVLAHKLDVSDRVIFVGQLQNPYPFIKSADCFVLSSDYEGQPMTLLEALAIGTHCIGTDIAGIRAVLGSVHGKVVPPTAQHLAQAMLLSTTDRSASPSEEFDALAYTRDVVSEFEDAVFL